MQCRNWIYKKIVFYFTGIGSKAETEHILHTIIVPIKTIIMKFKENMRGNETGKHQFDLFTFSGNKYLEFIFLISNFLFAEKFVGN